MEERIVWKARIASKIRNEQKIPPKRDFFYFDDDRNIAHEIKKIGTNLKHRHPQFNIQHSKFNITQERCQDLHELPRIKTTVHAQFNI